MMIRRTVPLLVLAALACCERPPVVATADKQQQTVASRVSGQVVAQGRSRGNAIVFLFDATNPPPPAGTGKPISFTIVSEQALYGPALQGASAGPFAAPFTFSLVQPGSYILEGFLDHDECVVGGGSGCRVPDFNAFYKVTDEPNQGDVLGGAADPATLRPYVFTVAADSNGNLNAITDVSVGFSDAIGTEPSDRPAFTVAPAMPRFPTDGGLLTMQLTATPIQAGVVDERRNGAFLVRYVDDNNDGQVDTVNGVPQLWPKIVVRKTDDNDPTHLTDETVSNGTPAAVVLAAGIYPTSSIFAALGPPSAPNRNPDGSFVVAPFPQLTVAVQHLALDASKGPPAPLPNVPSGDYALYALSFTGQTWRVPNELEAPVAAATGFTPVDTQSFVLQIPP